MFFDKIIKQMQKQISNQLHRIEQENVSNTTDNLSIKERQYLADTDINDVSVTPWMDTINNLLHKNDLSNQEEIYLRYIYISLQLKQIKEGVNQRNYQEELGDRWDRYELEDMDSDYIFYLHSYLRYLQSTDTEFTKAGARAEMIEELVEYILESERIADERIYSNAYELIGEGLGLTEEKFETLFE